MVDEDGRPDDLRLFGETIDTERMLAEINAPGMAPPGIIAALAARAALAVILTASKL